MYPRPPPHPNKQTSGAANKSSNSERVKSVFVVPSRVVSQPTSQDDIADGEETEIAAQITVPQEGGWSWVVVAASFFSIFFLDGVAFCFGSVFGAITEELQMEESLVGVINSIAVAIYFGFGPIASALINRFGFRTIIMSGSVISSFALFCSYFSTSFAALCLFYGGFAGVGYCLVNMSASLVVGFYFERLRSIALAIATTGSSIGIMVMFPLNTYVVNSSGWRNLTLLQSGLIGLIYFMGMTFKPLLSVTVTKTTDDPTRTVTYLPNLSTHAVKPAQSRAKTEGLGPTAAEKLFSAVSNYNFPTAAAVLDNGVMFNTPIQERAGVAGPSTLPVSKLTITAHTPRGGMSQRQIKQVQSMISRTSVPDKNKRNIELMVRVDEPKEEQKTKRKSCWAKICHWEDDIPQSRPMYRDDVFFDGKLERLPIYQKSMIDTPADQKTGFEYQLAVSRAVTTVDLQERKGVCTTAARRILASMMDPNLLKRRSFLMFCISAFMIYVGYLVPIIFLKNRNRDAGIEEVHCNWFVSVIGFSNAMGRLVLGAMAAKVNPLKLLVASCLIAGFSTAMSNFSFNVYFQYLCCTLFGFFIASIACLRSIVLVDLYGLEKLTNATGILLLFQGIACCISTPAASIVKSLFGFEYAFYIAGSFIMLSGLVLIPTKSMSAKEKLQESEKHKYIEKESQNKEQEP